MEIQEQLFLHLVRVISETNGITLEETLQLTATSAHVDTECKAEFKDFLSKLYLFLKRMQSFQIRESLAQKY